MFKLTCEKCKKEKFTNEFRYISNRHQYAKICKCCEANGQGKSSNHSLTWSNYRRYILEKWELLLEICDKSEMDKLLYELKRETEAHYKHDS